jgi:serine/threonine protein kinase
MSQLKKYRKVKYLGKGSYGAAILVELRSDPSQKFVVKEIVIGHLKPTEQQSAKNEAEVLHQMNHSNITMYVESFVENSKLYIVMEHADGGDLSSAIQKRKTEGKCWNEEEVMRIFVQICLALKHVHAGNILHRDLKSQNIFLTQNGMVKLGDFGIAKVLDASDDQARTQIGTPYYLSPEICESKPYGRKSDVWSLGVVLYELLALEMPFQATSLPALVHRICSAEPNYTKLEDRYSGALIALCKSLLFKNPDHRPSVNQVVRTDFIKDHISKLLSYTLKSGTGGVDGLIGFANLGQNSPEAQYNVHHRNIDPDEADRNIELLRNKEREIHKLRDNESKEQQIQRDKQQQREEEKEKLRKFRQDQLNRKNNSQNEGKDNESVVVAKPQSRALSPKSGARAAAVGNAASASSGVNYQNAYSNNNSARPAAQANPFQRQSPNPANKVKSLAEIQAERDSTAVAVAGPGQGEYVDAARREYFANRAAAQAFKARVEAQERGGVANSNTTNTNANTNMPNANGRRPSGNNINTGIVETVDIATLDPETRIAMLKAQREKEKDREIAEKEMQVSYNLFICLFVVNEVAHIITFSLVKDGY